MPGLVACKRRWDLGSDDFVYPGLAELFIRIVWLIAVAVVYGKQRSDFFCQREQLLHVYFIGMLIVLVLHILLDCVIIYISCQGTISNLTPRKRLPLVLYIKLFVFIPELAVTILGTLWAFEPEDDCSKAVVLALRATALVGWVVLASLLIGMIVVFDPLGGRRQKHRAGLLEDEEMSSAAKKLWELRCRVLCCNAGSDEQSTNAFSDVAQLLVDFFKGLDVVPTDIAAGLILVQIEQSNQPNRFRLEPLTVIAQPAPSGESSADFIYNIVLPPGEAGYQDTDIIRISSNDESPKTINSVQDDLPFPRPQPWMTVPMAAHYMKFASGSYGWAFFMYNHLCCGTCRLCTKCRCCACINSPSYVMDDNCCGCNTAAILKTTFINEQDIIYASFYNRVYQIPFYVALDHKHGAVVVSIRGTLSLKDALTDLSADSEPLDMPGVTGGSAHKGILNAAKFIQNTITNLQLLEAAYERCPDYGLVITGHSLGAGAASILSILLRPQYPDLKCFAFSPPGGLLSLSLARYTEHFILSVVVGKDLVPRLGFLTMEHLKAQILKVIRHTPVPKYKILAGGVWHWVKGESSLQEAVARGQHTDRSTLVDVERGRRSYTEEIDQTLDDAILACSRARLRQQTALYMPGHVLYIEEVEPSKRCCGTPLYQPAWARAENFDEIRVGPRMVTDHIPDTVSKALDQLADKDLSPKHVVKVYNSTAAVI